jgi:asparagine synthase (glutamine-hydrolysing)
MTDDVLAKVDRMSMAHSLEVRAPLLDHRILEFGARLPSDLKIRSGRGKVLLRELASRRLPPAVTSAPKRGFSIPAAGWLRGELRPLAESLLLDGPRTFREVLDEQKVGAMWREHLAGSRDHNVFLWGLMMFELWAKAAKTNAPAF